MANGGMGGSDPGGVGHGGGSQGQGDPGGSGLGSGSDPGGGMGGGGASGFDAQHPMPQWMRDMYLLFNLLQPGGMDNPWQSAVSWEDWQQNLNFDPLNGSERTNQAAGDRFWYDNYLRTFNNTTDNNVRAQMNTQHGFSTEGRDIQEMMGGLSFDPGQKDAQSRQPAQSITQSMQQGFKGGGGDNLSNAFSIPTMFTHGQNSNK
jgi:hypothetical protein